MSDFAILTTPTMMLLTPQTPAARAWVEEHLPDDALTWGQGIVIEPRYLPAILTGVRDDGLTVSPPTRGL